jgi:hypothetical protein
MISKRGGCFGIKTSKIIIISTVLVIVGIVVTCVMKNSFQYDSVLEKLKYGMTIKEVTKIVGDLGPNLSDNFYMRGFRHRLSDGRCITLGFDWNDETLMYLTLEEIDGEWAGEMFEYDLDKQELLTPYMPVSLMGIEYGMTIEEIEEVFRGDCQLSISFYNRHRCRSIMVLSVGSDKDWETLTDIKIFTIKLSTGNVVSMGFEVVHGSFQPTLGNHKPDEYKLLYAHMKASDGEWYVFDLNTQELTDERVFEALE